MLNGIEVLNEVEINGGNYWIMCIVILVAIFLVGLIGTIIVRKLTDCGVLLMAVGFILSVIFTFMYFRPESRPYYQYQVTISDSVSMVEFNERYDVIDVEGKIWTIVEK